MFDKTLELSIRRPRYCVFLWLLLAFVLALFGFLAGTRTILPGPTNIYPLLADPIENDAIQAAFPPKDTLLIMISHNSLAATAPEFVAARDALYQSLLEYRAGNAALPVFETIKTAGRTMLGDEHFTSADNKTVLIQATTRRAINFAGEELKMFPQQIADWKKSFPDFTAAYLSDGSANNELFDLIHNDLDRSLLLTLPITFLILVWVFETVVAALIPLVIAGVSLVSALGCSALLSHIKGPVSATASQLVVLLVLAIGVDYSLFIIKRVREEEAKGVDFEGALREAMGTTGLAVFWSALIVALSLSGLFLMQDTILASMALVSILAVVLTLWGTLFVLPSILMLTRKIISKSSKNIEGDKVPASNALDWIELSLRYPKVVFASSTALLLAISWFAFGLKLGATIEPSLLPESTQIHHAFGVLEDKFPHLAGTDFSILLRGKNLSDLDDEGELQSFFDAVLEHDSVEGPFNREFSPDGRFARFQFIARGSGNDSQNQDLIHDIRNRLAPELLHALNVETTVSGTLPYIVADIDRYSGRSLTVFSAILAASLMFLLIAFRSLVVPIKALFLNILSTLGAFGTLVIYFQLAEIAGPHCRYIESFVPPLLFAILFGLSMDYHVYLMCRVREEYLKLGDMRKAVSLAGRSTYKTVTGAAMIMVSVFLVVSTLSLPIMKQLGIGLAMAVILDATIIRCLLLPSSLILLNEWNWYLPKSLKWLPEVKLR